jgi:hypothetical protein
MPTITVDLDENLHAKLCELAGKRGKSPEETLAQIVNSPIGGIHAAQFGAPQKYFDEKRTVTDDEVYAAKGFLEERTGGAYPGHRREAVLYGLMQAAIDLETEICDDAGHEGFEHRYDLAQAILTDLLDRMYQLRKRGFI